MGSGELLAAVLALAPELKPREKTDRPAVTVPVEHLHFVMLQIRDQEPLKFDMLSCFTAIDWLKDGKIELVYQLYSTAHKHYLMIGVLLDRQNAVAPSVSSLWEIAEWQERELFDLFGVRFTDHPDLRRLLLEDDWQGHPLRKDYVDDFMLERPWR